MASFPQMDAKSPLTILNNLPKEHAKGIKQAFYNTAANIFVLLACAAGVAVYFILETFLKPLLWAVLCGAFLYPFKRTLTKILRRWLTNLHKNETPFVFGLVVTPIVCADQVIDHACNTVLQNIGVFIGACLGIPAIYVLWHFGPILLIVSVVKGLFIYTNALVGYFSSVWIWTLFVAYFVAVMLLWTDNCRNLLIRLSIPVWLVMILHVAASAGVLRMPLLIIMGMVMIVGFISEQNEVYRQQQEGYDPNTTFELESIVRWIMGDSAFESADTNKSLLVMTGIESSKAPPTVKTIGDPTTLQEISAEKPEATKPNTLSVVPETTTQQLPISQKVQQVLSPSGKSRSHHSLTDTYFTGLFWSLLVTRVWIHIWLIIVLLPIPFGLWLIKKLSLKLSSPDGPLGDKVKMVRYSLGNWIKDRKDVLLPNWLRGVTRLVMKGDQKIILVIESSLDKATSVLFILLLLVGSTLFGIIFTLQVHQESMYLVKTSSFLLNNSLHPELANWLPNNEDLQLAMDSMVGNAYKYGRNWIAAKVHELMNSPSNDNHTQIERQVLDMWDRLYGTWLARNVSSTSLARLGSTPFDTTNLTAIWQVITRADGFVVSDIVGFVKENIGTFLSVLESIWLVIKGNMDLVFTVLTSALSLVFGGGFALLNFIISSVIFLTSLFYLLASSGDQYKPIEWFSAVSPTTGGNPFGQAVQDAVGGVFMASLKMAAFYGLYTWLTHSLFGVNIVFIPSVLAAIFGAVPFVGAYLAAIPAVLELWLVQDQFVLAMLLLVIHILPSYVVDTAIYSEIKGGHPYMTGLAIAGGMYWLGLEGAIFGPIILCCLVVLVKVYGSMIKPESPSILAQHLTHNCKSL